MLCDTFKSGKKMSKSPIRGEPNLHSNTHIDIGSDVISTLDSMLQNTDWPGKLF